MSSSPPTGAEGVAQLGHRTYVGGLWEELGQLQFDFLRAQGLRPEHVLLDIACGCLRLGVKVIPYLEPEHYLGIDKESELLRAGLELELPAAVRQQRRPQLLCNDAFQFNRFGQTVDVAIAQSLFTHLPPMFISRCLEGLWPCLNPDGVLYATYFHTKEPHPNPSDPHDHRFFGYTQAEMERLGAAQKFRMEFIGDWGHPREQVMVAYRPIH